MNENNKLTISSPAFSTGEPIPPKYTCIGNNQSFPIHIDGLPSATQTLAIVMVDPDAPKGTFLHWLAWNLPPTENIEENSRLGISGKNDFGENGYGGPCRPSGTHRYILNIYALDSKLDVKSDTMTRAKLIDTIKGHILASGELIGKFSKDESV